MMKQNEQQAIADMPNKIRDGMLKLPEALFMLKVIMTTVFERVEAGRAKRLDEQK
jgi:hypothetical protein